MLGSHGYRCCLYVVIAAFMLGCAHSVPNLRKKKPTAGVPRNDVWNMYKNILDRPPDNEGLRHYSAAEISIAQVADELLRSKEFREKQGDERLAITQAELWKSQMKNYKIKLGDVNYLYIKLLGREPDEQGLAAYQRLMDDSKLTPSVYDVTLELLRSPEFQQVYAYWKILGREQDEAGQQHFAKIAAGDTDQPWALSVAQVVDELLRSDEFMERIQKLAALEGAEVNLVLAQAKTYAAVLKHFRLSDACVAFLYIKILGRYPDNGAKAHYATVMVDEILSVQQFTEELLRSDEFVAQGELALPNTDYIASALDIDSSDGLSDELCTMFTVGDHPSKEGDEPTIVDHAQTKSKLTKHSNSGV